MQRVFLQSSFLLLAVNILVKPLWVLGVERWVQNQYQAEYATYFLIYTLSILFSVLIDFGINTHIAVAYSINKTAFKNEIFTISVFKLGLSMVYVLFTMMYFFALQLNTHALSLLVLLCANQIVISYISYYRMQLAAHQQFTIDALVSSLDKLLLLGSFGILWLTNALNWQTFIYSQLAALVVSLVVVRWLAALRCTDNLYQFDIRIITKIVPQLLPFIGFVLLNNLYSRNDTFYLNHFGGSNATQYINEYAAVNRLYESASMFAVLLSAQLLPMFSTNINNTKALTDLALLCIRIMFCVYISLLVVVLFNGSIITTLLLKNFETAHIYALLWLMAGLLPFVLVQVLGALMLARRQIKLLIKAATVALLFNIIINFVLTKNMGIVGTCIANFLTQSIVGIWAVRFAISELGSEVWVVFFKQMIRYTIAVLGVAFVAFILNFTLLWCCAIVAVASIGVCMRLKIINLATVYNLLIFKK